MKRSWTSGLENRTIDKPVWNVLKSFDSCLEKSLFTNQGNRTHDSPLSEEAARPRVILREIIDLPNV